MTTSGGPEPARGRAVDPLRPGSEGYLDGALALDDLSFEAGSGETAVLVGPSGCGKTTLLRLIKPHGRA
ncbi:hypothetical protein SM007_32790 [Streptomyces avermitilis]|uniref:ATP-binding cassette domain-containing protein n=1 Tax=Streptomyces avermitilis TaxID=33903 RepID=UPI00099460B3|nr:ATP-binding cassette domain-containing protein [Streptomyces sp. SID5469]OOV21754.1 hypothetical protein SM007_32790 [Streptomyces avermitilis]